MGRVGFSSYATERLGVRRRASADARPGRTLDVPRVLRRKHAGPGRGVQRPTSNGPITWRGPEFIDRDIATFIRAAAWRRHRDEVSTCRGLAWGQDSGRTSKTTTRRTRSTCWSCPPPQCAARSSPCGPRSTVLRKKPADSIVRTVVQPLMYVFVFGYVSVKVGQRTAAWGTYSRGRDHPAGGNARKGAAVPRDLPSHTAAPGVRLHPGDRRPRAVTADVSQVALMKVLLARYRDARRGRRVPLPVFVLSAWPIGDFHWPVLLTVAPLAAIMCSASDCSWAPPSASKTSRPAGPCCASRSCSSDDLLPCGAPCTPSLGPAAFSPRPAHLRQRRLPARSHPRRSPQPARHLPRARCLHRAADMARRTRLPAPRRQLVVAHDAGSPRRARSARRRPRRHHTSPRPELRVGPSCSSRAAVRTARPDLGGPTSDRRRQRSVQNADLARHATASLSPQVTGRQSLVPDIRCLAGPAPDHRTRHSERHRVIASIVRGLNGQAHPIGRYPSGVTSLSIHSE